MARYQRDGCVALLLLVSPWALGAASSELDNSTTAGSPCLCIFDFDRTLTGKQGDTHHCHKNQVIKAIHDDAYGGGPLTLSELALGLDKTFCHHCYLGVISHGNANGEKSQMRERLLVMLNMNKEQHLRVPDIWSKASSSGAVSAPLVVSVKDSAKHAVAHGIRTWYGKHNNLHFHASQTYFFDDNTKNVEEFKGSGYNAIQVSCKSRDSTKHSGIGWCGGTISECKSTKGVHLCHHSDAGVAGLANSTDGQGPDVPAIIV